MKILLQDLVEHKSVEVSRTWTIGYLKAAVRPEGLDEDTSLIVVLGEMRIDDSIDGLSLVQAGMEGDCVLTVMRRRGTNLLEVGKEWQLCGGKPSLMGRYKQGSTRSGKPGYNIVDGSGHSNCALIHWEDGSRSGGDCYLGEQFWGITGNDESSGSLCVPKRHSHLASEWMGNT
jgi:hypothetical protein